MNGLDLFSGIGGISRALAPWVRPVAYCEIDRYAQGVLLSRMASGDLPCAPVWDDVATLRGCSLPPVDIVYGGFPCQDISVAGTGRGLDGKRSGLFFEVLRLVTETGPSFVFLENVPAIRTRGGERVGKELASLGYDCRWLPLSAASVGANHLRRRWFLLAAHAERLQLREQPGRSCGSGGAEEALPRINGATRDLAHAHGEGQLCISAPGLEGGHGISHGGEELGEAARSAFATAESRQSFPAPFQSRARGVGQCGFTSNVANGSRQRWREGRPGAEIWSGRHDVASSCEAGPQWWATEPNVDRVVNGLPHRVDRIKGLGNAVVPAQARQAFLELMGL